ncbi:MAG: dihydrolipoyl dehydrogenase [Asgard group archaeon]|nr:dihydrolipoyl dehydrogenase [Asgard group archaeon]
MKHYDIIAIGSGTVARLVKFLLEKNPDLRIAVIDKDEIGGICLTRACVPSKLLLYPADFARDIRKGENLGVSVSLHEVNFGKILTRMRKIRDESIIAKAKFLKEHPQIDYYSGIAEFVEPYVLKIGEKTIRGEKIFLTLGSEPAIPSIKGINSITYETNKTILNINQLPKSIAFIGGGYIAAEYGHFFATMGADVTIFGRNPQFLPDEEPEIAAVVLKEMQQYMTIYTNHEVTEVKPTSNNQKKVIVTNRLTKETHSYTFEMVIVAAGRVSNSHLLKPEKSGVQVTKKGWIKTNEYLETSQPNIWSFGDANGKYLLKHTAYYEGEIIQYNLSHEDKREVSYDIIPHAVFSYPKIGAVGMKEKEAIKKIGKENLLIGYSLYRKTVKGKALGLENSDYFMKLLVNKTTKKILGAHIVGPNADILIHEVILAMNTNNGTLQPLVDSIYIHPTLPELIEFAAENLLTVDKYHEKIGK